MPIVIFVTGGTFDKEYNEFNGRLYFKDTHLPEMLKLARCKLKTIHKTIIMVDSLKMTNKERNQIIKNCQQTSSKKIIITHGTDTMVKTARKLLNAKIKDKTIILTGAMIPYKFGSSDGLFNLGSALAFVQTLPPGVYIAMNGEYFYADNVKKNIKKGQFERIKE